MVTNKNRQKVYSQSLKQKRKLDKKNRFKKKIKKEGKRRLKVRVSSRLMNDMIDCDNCMGIDYCSLKEEAIWNGMKSQYNYIREQKGKWTRSLKTTLTILVRKQVRTFHISFFSPLFFLFLDFGELEFF